MSQEQVHGLGLAATQKGGKMLLAVLKNVLGLAVHGVLVVMESRQGHVKDVLDQILIRQVNHV
jgi:hypothetical protein